MRLAIAPYRRGLPGLLHCGSYPKCDEIRQKEIAVIEQAFMKMIRRSEPGGRISHVPPSTVTKSYIHAAPAVATVAGPSVFSRSVAVHHSPAVAVAHAPVATQTVAVHAAPAVAVHHAAPAIAVRSAPVQAVNVGVVAAAPTAGIRSHEVHTSSGRQAIRIEDFQAGDQVIRVHEGPQAAPQVAQIAVPGEQHHVRVINHPAGPAHVERKVHRQQTQVIDLQKPGRPGVRIVQVVRGQSPPPSVEFVNYRVSLPFNALSPLLRSITPLLLSRPITPLLLSRSITPLPLSRSITPLQLSRSITPLPLSRSITPLPLSRSITPLPLLQSITPFLLFQSITPLPLLQSTTPQLSFTTKSIKDLATCPK
ncbi:hypothetical protein BIW11_03337 [Tropilaelaps mercedesae]|uniref:Uncharacterized protein n=1 Tax=Tropilaelaps mercedesae TaxID=418985 RepID=A0A1V9XNB5_9ACAR|nr:hypothetical protein BIW11_03337 [Tropilaelaps mercedesae]